LNLRQVNGECQEDLCIINRETKEKNWDKFYELIGNFSDASEQRRNQLFREVAFKGVHQSHSILLHTTINYAEY
jgi:hypothetical protein